MAELMVLNAQESDNSCLDSGANWLRGVGMYLWKALLSHLPNSLMIESSRPPLAAAVAESCDQHRGIHPFLGFLKQT